MAKQKIAFVCTECGRVEQKWLGRCPDCGQWNTFTEEAVAAKDNGKGTSRVGKTVAGKAANRPRSLTDVEADAGIRFSSGIAEMDKVLGGGIVKGSTVLVGGEPGIGKSTLLLQVLALSEAKKALYVSGEESLGQIKLRAERLQLPHSAITVLCETNLEKLSRIIAKEKYDLVVIDSIQTLYSEEAGPVPGTVNQLKFGTIELTDTAREMQLSLFLIGHVTKDGTIAGPKVVEHLVDSVLYFDQAEGGVRILRTSKNRFGSIDEIGIFVMTGKGLVSAVNPESFFMGRRKGSTPPGVVAAAVFEGSRTFMVEIQALTVPVSGGYSRVYSDKIDTARVSRVAAVIEKHTGIKFGDYDIYINVAGGIKLSEVGIELPLATALLSARMNKPVPQGLAAAGELSLAGEVRMIGHLDKRLSTAEQMKFHKFIGPDVHNASQSKKLQGTIYLSCSGIKEVAEQLFN